MAVQIAGEDAEKMFALYETCLEEITAAMKKMVDKRNEIIENICLPE